MATTSARNEFKGAVIQVNRGSVNDEIVMVMDGSSTRLVATITSTSAKSLGLEIGSRVVAIFKAQWVVLMTDTEGVKFSARNQFAGTIVAVKEGVVNVDVRIRLDGGEVITALVSAESARGLGLEAGSRVTALIKASHIILGALES